MRGVYEAFASKAREGSLPRPGLPWRSDPGDDVPCHAALRGAHAEPAMVPGHEHDRSRTKQEQVYETIYRASVGWGGDEPLRASAI